MLTHQLRLFFVALQFLTRLPIPAWVGHEPGWLTQAVRYFPLVGALVGSLGAAVALAAHLVWPPLVAATLALASTLWLTAAFHEDGLADTFDALLGAAAREQALFIMKDSRIGSYGAAALVLSLLLRVALLAALLAHHPAVAAVALVAAHTAGRASAVLLMALLPYAGDEAHAKAKPLARDVRSADALCAVAVGLAALVGAALVGATLVGETRPALLALPVAAAGLLLLVATLRRWLHRRLGGYTGDTLGACEQFGELVVLLAFVATVAP